MFKECSTAPLHGETFAIITCEEVRACLVKLQKYSSKLCCTRRATDRPTVRTDERVFQDLAQCRPGCNTITNRSKPEQVLQYSRTTGLRQFGPTKRSVVQLLVQGSDALLAIQFEARSINLHHILRRMGCSSVW